LGFISPVVAKLADEHGVDLYQVAGTGLGGRITKKDVLGFLEARKGGVMASAAEAPRLVPAVPPPPQAAGPLTPPPPAPGSQADGEAVIRVEGMRRLIAEHMVRSKHTAPHVTTVFEADLSRVLAHQAAHQAEFARDGVKLTLTAYFVSAIVAGLKAAPIVNSQWAEDTAGPRILLKREINVGVAVALEAADYGGGLIVPVLKRADEKSLLGLAREINDLARRARARALKPDEVQGGTFSLTNHGVSGSLFATPIINQPQTGILGVGAVQKRVMVVTQAGQDSIAIRPMVYLTLTFDHRVLDGATGDRFMQAVKAALENWS
jgi:2-oxoglutarate dehydrogenase E2 component (dihydrolipoamide succinyltransferase)